MSAADDFNKILFADAVLDLLAAKVVERLAATGGGQDKAAGIQVKVESGQDWVSAKVARAVLGRSDSWLHRTAQQHPEIKRSMKQPHQKVGRPLYSLRRIYRILEDSETTKNQCERTAHSVQRGHDLRAIAGIQHARPVQEPDAPHARPEPV